MLAGDDFQYRNMVLYRRCELIPSLAHHDSVEVYREGVALG